MSRAILPVLCLLACGPPEGQEPVDPNDYLAPLREGPIPAGGGVVARSDGGIESVYRSATGPTVRVLHVGEALATSRVDGEDYATAQVHYAIDEPVILVLHSQRLMRWEIVESFPGSVQGLHLLGNASSIGPNRIETEVSRLPFESYDLDLTHGHAREIEGYLSDLGLEPHSWHFTDAVTSITVEPTGEPNVPLEEPDCALPGQSLSPHRDLVRETCPALAEEPIVCLVWGPGARWVSPTSTTACPLDVAPRETLATIGWAGDEVFTCEGSGAVVRTNLRTGDTSVAYIPCAQATVAAENVVVNGDIYASFEDVACRRSTQSISGSILGGGSAGVITHNRFDLGYTLMDDTTLYTISASQVRSATALHGGQIALLYPHEGVLSLGVYDPDVGAELPTAVYGEVSGLACHELTAE